MTATTSTGADDLAVSAAAAGQTRRPWQQVVAEKRAARKAAIDAALVAVMGEDNGDGNDDDDTITGIDDAAALAAAIASCRFTAEEVARAYIRRAIKVHEKTNCFTEILFDRALLRARHLDKHLAETGKTVGPFHGLPMTLKDQFDVKGYDTTMGYVGRAFQPADRDSTLVMMLEGMGAVVLGKTNIPQSIMWCETENPLFGLTTNPTHAEYTPGGSTGGEGALLSCRGSLLGWGTDIGGSIRIPSHMMGLYGFKPSSARLPYRDVPVSTDGQEHVPSSIGPMARSLSTIHLAMQNLIHSGRPWELDARVAPIPWRQEAYDEMLTRPLVIGVLRDDGVVRPHPPVTAVLMRAVEMLKDAGHVVVEWDEGLHEDAIAVMDEFYTADGCEDIRRAVEAGGEPYIPHVEKLLARCGGSPLSVYEYWQLNRRKRDIQNAYLDKWRNRTVEVGSSNGGGGVGSGVNGSAVGSAGGVVAGVGSGAGFVGPSNGVATPAAAAAAVAAADAAGGGTIGTRRVPVDALLMPPMPHAAVPHGGCRWVGYTKVWNLLDYTALVIPGGHVGEDDDDDDDDDDDRFAAAAAAYEAAGREQGGEKRGELDAWNRKLWEQRGAQMAGLKLPVGVQIVGRRLEEEKVLGVGKVVDDLLLRARRKT